MATPLNGGKTRARVGASFYLGVEEWRVEPSAVLTEYTSTESTLDAALNTHVDRFSTAVDATVTLTFYFDSDNNPIGTAAPNLQAGATVSALRLFVESTVTAGVRTSTVGTHRNFYFPTLLVEGVPVTVRVKDKVMVTATFKTSGAWYYPGTTGSS